MPIKTLRIEPGIIHHRWQGHVSADEVLEAADRELHLLKEDGLARCISIVDCSEMRTFQVNIKKLSKAMRGDEILTLVYKAPKVSEIVGEIIANLTKAKMEFFSDWDALLIRARQSYREYQQHMTQPKQQIDQELALTDVLQSTNFKGNV
jgi:hypothetical protein